MPADYVQHQADALDELLKFGQDNQAEASQQIRRIQQHSTQLTAQTGPLREHGRRLSVAQAKIKAARDAVDEIVTHLRASHKVEALLHKASGAALEFGDFMQALDRLDVARHWLEDHSQLRVSSAALQQVQAVQEQALARCEREFRDVLNTESKGLELGPTWLDNVSNTRVPPAEHASAITPDTAPMARLTSLAAHMLRGGRSSCLKVYTDQRRLLYGPVLQVATPAPDRDGGAAAGGGGGAAATDAVEKKVGLWVRSVLAVLVVLIAERDTCGAVFGRQIGPKVFAEVGHHLVEALVKAGEAVLGSRRLPEKLFPMIEMYVQVSDLAPKLEVTLLGTPLESYTERMYQLQRSIKAEAQALLTALEEVIHVGGEGGSGRNVPPEVEAGTVMPVCAYMARFLKRIFRLTTEQLLILVPDKPQDQLGPVEMETRQALASVAMRTIVVALQFLEQRAEGLASKALGHVFLVNNIHFLVRQAEQLPELGASLGSRWVSNHKQLVQQHMDDYIHSTWQAMAEVLDPPGGPDPSVLPAKIVKDRFKAFNTQFEAASAAARKWVVPDAGLKATLRDTIGDCVVPVYREWLGHPAVATLAFGKNASKYLKFSPEDLEVVIHQQLFEGRGLVGASG